MFLNHDIGCPLEEDQKHLHEFKTSNSIFKLNDEDGYNLSIRNNLKIPILLT